MADVLNVELVTVNTPEGAAFGAALLAAVGIGAFDNVPAACEQTVAVTGRTFPGPHAAAYPAYYEQYKTLYPALAAEFEALAALSG
jgi:xylulokinase